VVVCFFLLYGWIDFENIATVGDRIDEKGDSVFDDGGYVYGSFFVVCRDGA
jgi:hypothetical protein